MDLPPEPVPQPGAVPGIILRRHGGDEAVRPGSPIGVGARHSVAAAVGAVTGGGGGGEGDGGEGGASNSAHGHPAART